MKVEKMNLGRLIAIAGCRTITAFHVCVMRCPCRCTMQRSRRFTRNRSTAAQKMTYYKPKDSSKSNLHKSSRKRVAQVQVIPPSNVLASLRPSAGQEKQSGRTIQIEIKQPEERSKGAQNAPEFFSELGVIVQLESERTAPKPILRRSQPR